MIVALRQRARAGEREERGGEEGGAVGHGGASKRGDWPRGHCRERMSAAHCTMSTAG